MGSLIILVASAIFAFLSLYIFFNLGKKDQAGMNVKDETDRVDKAFLMFFRLLSFAVFLFCIFLMAKAGLDEYNYCSVMPVNATLNGSVTSYDYERVCFDNDTSTGLGFYELVNWYLRIVVVFFGLLIFWGLLSAILEWIRRKR